MNLDRRQLLAGSGALLASCTGPGSAPAAAAGAALDEVLAANAAVLPEAAGSGANHYPMAAEALSALGAPERIPARWRDGAASYGPVPVPMGAIDGVGLGDWTRYGDWLERFQGELAREPWRDVLARWTPRLAPGVSAALFHGLLRTAHAARALRGGASDARRAELAAGLAYWAARYAPLEVAPDAPPLDTPLWALDNRWIDDDADVPFDALHERLERAPVAPRVTEADLAAPARERLERTVAEAAAVLLEMLVAERQRIWILHAVTGPAAAALLVPELGSRDADALAAWTRQAAAALVIAFGVPCTPRAHLRQTTPPWGASIARAAASGSVHTIKLIEALDRFRHVDEPLCRSVAAQWFEWT